MSSFRKQHPIAKAFDRSALGQSAAGAEGFSIIPTTIHKDSAMKHGHTSRGLRAVAILSIMALVGACADSTSAPTTSEVSVKGPAGFNKVVDVQTFRYEPKSGVTKRLGEHVISFPANSICEIGTSGYGAEFWDKPCTASSKAIMITAIIMADNEGHPYIDFQPAMRFVPTKEVNLYLKDGPRNTGNVVTMLYCTTVVCTDEAKSDPTLVTRRIGNSRILVRRIKHFSGYQLGLGDACSGTVMVQPDGGLYCDLDGGSSKSGYMLASGLGKSGNGTTFGKPRRSGDK